jgi:hypothetical protein
MENQETQQPAQGPELTVTDLQNIKAIIDAASRRGAFSASEMAGVGNTFNRLDAFLNAVTPETGNESESQT